MVSCSRMFFSKAACNVAGENVGGNNREHLSMILGERAHGSSICFVILFNKADGTANRGPSAYE